MQQKDCSQLKTNYMVAIDALTKCEQRQRELFEELFSAEWKLSHTKMSYAL